MGSGNLSRKPEKMPGGNLLKMLVRNQPKCRGDVIKYRGNSQQNTVGKPDKMPREILNASEKSDLMPWDNVKNSGGVTHNKML